MFLYFARFSQIINLIYKLLSAIFINQLMMIQNSNSQEASISKTADFYFSKLPDLQKRLQIIIKELKLPLNYIFPSDFEEKYEEAKNHDFIDNYWIQNYKEIVAFIIEGQINTSLMRLSQKFRHQFGGQTMFWMDLICSFAQNQKFEQNFRIWQVLDLYKHCLHLQKGQYQKNRKFRRLAKTDIQVSKKLISSICQLKSSRQSQNNLKPTQQLLSKVEANYNHHQDSNKKLVDFLKSEQHKNINLDFFQSRNLIFRQQRSKSSQSFSGSRTKKTQKQKERQNNILKQRMITDFSVNFREDKNSSLLRKIVGRNQLLKEQLEQKKFSVEQNFKNFSQNNQQIESLREQLKNLKPKVLKKFEPSLNNIFISYSYLTFTDFFISSERQAQFQLRKPFEQYPDINYDNNDYEEYEELQGEQLLTGDSQLLTDDSSLDTNQKQQFYQESNPYEMEAEDMQVFNKAIRKDKTFFGKPWILNLTKQQPIQFIENQSTPVKGNVTQQMIQQFFDQSSVLCPCASNLPFKTQPIQSEGSKQDNGFSLDDIQTLKKIVHMRSYDEVITIIEQDQSLQARFPRTKINMFINKWTKKIKKKVDGKKLNIYHVLDQEIKKSKNSSKIRVPKVAQINQSKSSASQVTSVDEVNSQQEKVQHIQEVKMVQKCSTQNQKVPNKLYSQPKSLSNKTSFRGRKRGKKEQKKLEVHEDKSVTLSTRLRSRSSKPVYNIDTLLGKKSRQKLDNQEHQI